MPRVKLDPYYEAKVFRDLMDVKKAETKMKNEDIAMAIGASKCKVSNSRSHGTWTYRDLRKIFKVLSYTDEEILKVMKL